MEEILSELYDPAYAGKREHACQTCGNRHGGEPADSEVSTVDLGTEEEQRAYGDGVADGLRHAAEATYLLRRLVAVIDVALVRWSSPVPSDAIAAIHDAKEFTARLAASETAASAGGRRTEGQQP